MIPNPNEEPQPEKKVWQKPDFVILSRDPLQKHEEGDFIAKYQEYSIQSNFTTPESATD